MKKHTTIPLDNQPEIAQALGRMLGHWAILENKLSYILGTLLGLDQSRLHMLYHSFNSVSSKINLIERLIHIYTFDSDEKTTLLSLIKTASDLNATRNTFVHGLWVEGTEKDNLIMFDMRVPGKPTKRTRGFKVFSSTTINSFVQNISELSLKLDKFRRGDMKKMPMSIVPLE